MIKSLRIYFLSIFLIIAYSDGIMAKTTEYKIKSKEAIELSEKSAKKKQSAKKLSTKLLKNKASKKQSFKNKKSKKKRLKKSAKKKSSIKKAFKKVKKKKHGFSGGISFKSALDDGDSTMGASIKWKPILKDYYYFKVGLKHDFSADKDKFSYSWHLGYDDWHEGTWTAQINHWGGIRPGEGFESEKAIASLGYKVKLDFLKERKLKSGITISKKLGGDAPFKLGTSLQWAPKKFWYIKAIIIHPLNGDDPTWNYLFGYDDWHPNTWGFEYSNYDTNPLNEMNFTKSGKFALTYKWEY